jgi:hypothetical protein
LLISLKENNPDAEILAAASGDDYYPCSASYYGGKGIFDPTMLIEKLPDVKKRSLLVLMIYDPDLLKFQPLISNPEIQKLYRTGNSNFYLLELFP